jgi:uncharacterized protein YdiU (UPF0061 family)
MLVRSNSYLQLPPIFYERVRPTPVQAPSFVAFNEPLAATLGYDHNYLHSPEALAILSGTSVQPNSDPIALAYSGHQFGHFVPLLGDGRAVLLGEIESPTGMLYDVQLKGSGKTPFSRRGDGRAALGPMMREYIIGEALHALGIPATRTLAVVASGETVLRERPLPGGIQTRIARSHIRIGTFEYAASRGDATAVKALADYVIRRHYPELSDHDDAYYELARLVFARQAQLVAQWMHVGFIHGVMNTDNIAVSGESIDFGPCAFMNHYDPNTVFSSIDQHGRYAYGAQPGILQWNLARFVEALVPLLSGDQEHATARAQGLVDSFPALFSDYWYQGMRQKLGLIASEPGDTVLIKELLEAMYRAKLDYTTTSRALSGDTTCTLPEALHTWRTAWETRVTPERNIRAREETLRAMQQINPAVIARNYLVEEALTAGVEHNDFSVMNNLVTALREPYTQHARYSLAPQGDDQTYRTFCGT